MDSFLKSIHVHVCTQLMHRKTQCDYLEATFLRQAPIKPSWALVNERNMKCLVVSSGQRGTCPTLFQTNFNEVIPRLGGASWHGPNTHLFSPILVWPCFCDLPRHLKARPTVRGGGSFFWGFLRQSPFCAKIGMFFGYFPRFLKQLGVLLYMHEVVNKYSQNKYDTLSLECVQSTCIALIHQL